MRFRFALLSFIALSFTFGGCTGSRQNQPDLEENGSPKDEISQISEKISKDTTNVDLYHQRARLYLEQGLINQALNDLGNAIELDPDQPELYLTLADAYLMMGKLPSCIESLQKAEKLDPDNNDALLKLAEVYLVLQDYDNTYKYVERSIDLDTKNPKAYFIRGYAMMEVGDTLGAIRNMQNALDQDQGYYEAAVQLGILYSIKRNPLAEQYFAAAIKIDPNNDAAYYLLGLFYQDNAKMNEAMETYSQLVTINPGFKEAYYNMGYINLVHYQDFEKAIDYFSQAIDLDDNYVDAWFNRGYSYELAGNVEKARQDYKKALDIKPNYERAVSGMNRLDLQ